MLICLFFCLTTWRWSFTEGNMKLIAIKVLGDEGILFEEIDE